MIPFSYITLPLLHAKHVFYTQILLFHNLSKKAVNFKVVKSLFSIPFPVVCKLQGRNTGNIQFGPNWQIINYYLTM